MPSKNSIGRYYKRHPFISKALWKKYNKSSEEKVSYEDFKAIIKASLEETKNWVLREPIGFQLPKKLGHLAINKFKTYGDFKCYSNLKTSDGKPFLNHNLHTGGYTFRIQLFLSSRSFADRIPYWHFDAERKFNRALSPILFSQKSPAYNEFMQDHFTKDYYIK